MQCAATFYTNTALSVVDCRDNQDIPHLEARVDIDNSYKESSLNLHPSQDLMNQAYKVKINMRRVQQKPFLQELTNLTMVD